MGFKELLGRIESALDDLTTLNIVTAVGRVTLPAKDAASGPVPPVDRDAKVMRTSIDLLRGDMTTVMDPDFVTGPYQALREYHAAREKQGAAIIQANIEALKSLKNLAKEMASHPPDDPKDGGK